MEKRATAYSSLRLWATSRRSSAWCSTSSAWICNAENEFILMPIQQSTSKELKVCNSVAFDRN